MLSTQDSPKSWGSWKVSEGSGGGVRDTETYHMRGMLIHKPYSI